MLARRSRWTISGLVACLVITACGAGPSKHAGIVWRDRSEMPTDRDPTIAADELAWRPCDDVPTQVTQAWECSELLVPLDHDEAAGETIELVLTRPPLAAGDERQPLLFNPGGPGGSGVALVWLLGDELPPALLDRYYPVGWDPRGVARSTPVDCGAEATWFVADECIERTGDLLRHVAAPDSARDMDIIRVALGQQRLDYVGYSYGTALGATYAALFPDRVGRFVLDGAIDPDSASPDSQRAKTGRPWYAGDDLADVVDRFESLCDLAPSCLSGSDIGEVRERLDGRVAALPTDWFDESSGVGDVDLQRAIERTMYDTGAWGLLADALADADRGDGSALAALVGYLQAGYPPIDPDLMNSDVAHYAVYCADFSGLDDDHGCDGMPAADEPLPIVSAVDVAEPILVIGNSYDPATPGRHADELATRLGDAVHITWDAVGHTAFPSSACIDDIVVGYLVDGIAPRDATRCPFVDSITEDAVLATFLFDGFRRHDTIQQVLVAEGTAEAVAACMADELDDEPRRTVTHVVLGVQSPVAIIARRAAASDC